MKIFKINNKKTKIILLALVLGVFMTGGIIYATVAEGFRINNTVTTEVDAHGTCKNVVNNSGKNMFVPTKTTAEWTAFRDNKPSGVALADCGLTHISGYGHTWTSMSPLKSKMAAVEACRQYYTASGHSCQCSFVDFTAAALGGYYAGYAMVIPGSWCKYYDASELASVEASCCDESWTQPGVNPIWIYYDTGQVCSDWLPGKAGDPTATCARPLRDWY